MKKKIKPHKTKLFVTSKMLMCWKEFFGDQAKVPRAPRKFLHRFIKDSNSELLYISFIFKELFYDKLKNEESILEAIIEQSDFMEKNLCRIYDDCRSCTRFSSRYRRQIERQIDSFSRYSLQANQVRTCIINKRLIKNVTTEKIFLGRLVEVFPEDILNTNFFKAN